MSAGILTAVPATTASPEWSAQGLCGVYLDVDSTDPVDSTGPLVRVRATRTDTGLGSRPALAGGER